MNDYFSEKNYFLILFLLKFWNIYCLRLVTSICNGGARGVVVIVVGNGHGDMNSNPGCDWLHFK